eukprot:5362362-Karenia_brevis.AAC.1
MDPNDGQIYTSSEIEGRCKDTLTPEVLQDFWDKSCASIERSNPTSWAKDAKPKVKPTLSSALRSEMQGVNALNLENTSGQEEERDHKWRLYKSKGKPLVMPSNVTRSEMQGINVFNLDDT